jgi:fumarate reductase subunit D
VLGLAFPLKFLDDAMESISFISSMRELLEQVLVLRMLLFEMAKLSL